MEKVLVTAGIACILAAIIGGGLKAFNIEIPILRSRFKQIAIGLLGICCIYASLRLPSLTNAKQAEEGLFIGLEIADSKAGDQLNHQIIQIIDKRLEGFGIEKSKRKIYGEKNKISISLNNTKFSPNLLDVISKPARLEFKARDESSSLDEKLPKIVNLKPADEEVLLKSFEKLIPPYDEVLFERFFDEKTKSIAKRPVILERKLLMDGSAVSDARVRINPEYQEQYIELTFGAAGAKIFEEITAAHVGKRVSIILDGVVYSSPVVRERIPGGKAQITGAFVGEEANNIAIALKAGALPTQVKVTEVKELTTGWLWKLLWNW
jgi:protein-export membrane protein SecD